MIQIVTIVSSNPDLILLQYQSIKKYVKDDFEYIVINNARCPSFMGEVVNILITRDIYKIKNLFSFFVKRKKVSLENKLISDICLKLRIKEFHVKEVSSISNAKSADPSRIVAYTLNWLFGNSEIINSEIVCLIDSDMFFISEVSLVKLLGDKIISFIPQRKGEISYIWTGFFIVKVDFVKELDFSLGLIGKIRTDVGGYTYFRLKYLNENDVNYIHFLNFQVIKRLDQFYLIEASLNGDYNLSFACNFSGNLLNYLLEFPSAQEKSELFHDVKVNNDIEYVQLFRNNLSLVIGANFSPINIDLIQISRPSLTSLFPIPFLIHYKNSSNPRNFDSKTYRESKMNWLQGIVNDGALISSKKSFENL
jgi:hypothetical protein